MTNVLYATSFACDGIDKIGASTGDVGHGHAVVLQFGCVSGDFPCFIYEQPDLQFAVFQKLKPLSFMAESCLLVLVRLVVIAVN